MHPTFTCNEDLHRFPRPERNLNQTPHRLLTPASPYSPNISRSSSDTSPESHYESFISNYNLKNNRNEEFRQYELFGPSSHTDTFNISKTSFDTPKKIETPAPQMATPFMHHVKPLLGRTIYPTTGPHNQHLLSCSNSNPFRNNTQISQPDLSTRVNGFLSDTCATVSPRNFSLEEWQLVNTPTINNSISSNERPTSPFSTEFLSTGNSAYTNLVNFEAIESSAFYLSESSISPINRMTNASFEYVPNVSPMTNLFHFEKLDQETESSGQFNETSISPINSMRNASSTEYVPNFSPMTNLFHFEKLDQETELSGLFNETLISPINCIRPGSIGYMPRVSTITNPIDFEKLNREAESYESGGNKVCTFCKKNGERPKVYTTHYVKVKVGDKYKVTCPVLRSYVCTVCDETGDNAHTITYCPALTKSNTGRPTSTTVTLKATRMKSNGKKRFN